MNIICGNIFLEIMLKKLFLPLLLISVFFIFSTSIVSADELNPGNYCEPGKDICCKSSARPCIDDGSYSCLPEIINGVPINSCQISAVGQNFGKIDLPNPLKNLLKNDQTGAGAISLFLSNGVVLIYSIATIVLLFMLLWAAFDWMTSGGDKEKLAGAQRKIINAIIGILLFAVAFAVIEVLGTFTGFKFFKGQNVQVLQKDSNGNILEVQCPDGKKYDKSKMPTLTSDPETACKGRGI